MSLEIKKQDSTISKSNAIQSKIEKINQQLRSAISQNAAIQQETFIQSKILETNKLIHNLLVKKFKTTKNPQLKLIYDRFTAVQNPDFVEIAQLHLQICYDEHHKQRLALELKNETQALDEQINYQQRLRDASLLLAKDSHDSCVTIGWGIYGKHLSEAAIKQTHVAGRADIYNSTVEAGLRTNAAKCNLTIERLITQKHELTIAKKLRITQIELGIIEHSKQIKQLTEAFNQKYPQLQLDVLLSTEEIDLTKLTKLIAILDQYLSLEESNETLEELGKFEIANTSNVIASLPKINNVESGESNKQKLNKGTSTQLVLLSKPTQNHTNKKAEASIKINEDVAEVEFQDYSTDQTTKSFSF